MIKIHTDNVNKHRFIIQAQQFNVHVRLFTFLIYAVLFGHHHAETQIRNRKILLRKRPLLYKQRVKIHKLAIIPHERITNT